MLNPQERSRNPDIKNVLYTRNYEAVLGQAVAEYFSNVSASQLGSCELEFYQRYIGYNCTCIFKFGDKNIELHFGFYNQAELEKALAQIESSPFHELSIVLAALKLFGTETGSMHE